MKLMMKVKPTQNSSGHLDCLKWAHEHGCDWSSHTCRDAALGGNLDCLIWAREHGCPWNPVKCRVLATKYKHNNILDWMSSIGY